MASNATSPRDSSTGPREAPNVPPPKPRADEEDEPNTPAPTHNVRRANPNIHPAKRIRDLERTPAPPPAEAVEAGWNSTLARPRNR